MIGASLHMASRFRREIAQPMVEATSAVGGSAALCKAEASARHPLNTRRVVYHFRTPSPDGQCTPDRFALPVYFYATSRGWRVSAHQMRNGCNFSHRCSVSVRCVAGHIQYKGAEQWVSNLGSSQPWLHRALQHVATPSVNKPSQAVPSAQVPRPSPAAALHRVPPSGPQATSSTASSTRASVNSGLTSVASALRFARSAAFAIIWQQSCVYWHQWAQKARNRGSYYDTYGLHFHFGRTDRAQRVHATVRRIQPRRHFAVGTARHPLISRGSRPHPSQHAFPVPPLRLGGFLRCANTIKRDTSCSTRS